ncbi:hypothetical protein [Aldersonia kunmingensis]|uniref:hypothetical protein n=1 Tax=Aldersonia kunmingensis TaxID=408066 RepID=UPI00082F8130|nr:hypothetical protein [Aldersonia kunmingensis]
MALHRKTHLLAALEPTIAVLPESSSSAQTKSALEAIGATSVAWIGGNPNKGLSVAAFGDWQLRIDGSYDPGYQWVMPVHVTGPAHIRMLAVWDMNHRGSGYQSALDFGSCRASIAHYEEFLSGDADLVLISGDFNNSVNWDKPTKRAKFGDFMDELESRGFASAYHLQRGSERGNEADATLWWTRNSDKPYHIDYTFVSRPDAIDRVDVGAHSEWLAHSDHSPMTIDLRIQTRAANAGSDYRRIERAQAQQPKRAPRASHPDNQGNTLQHLATQDGSMRFDLVAGELPDMRCGVNGEPWASTFRPTHVTARSIGGVIVEVKIWGPQVRTDGSLGKRLIDHVWRRTHANGGVDLADLPSSVAAELGSRPVDGHATQ